MLFSFVSLIYNHEGYIIQHLESIKYQIQQFGQNYRFELILCDDNSGDKTKELALDWLSANQNLFEDTHLLFSSQNRGIVRNVIEGLKRISGDYFKILAGDDMYSTSNLFDCVNYLKKYDVVQSALLEFNGDDIVSEKKYFQYVNNFLSLNPSRLNKRAQVGNFVFRAPGFFFKKEFLTGELFELMLRFEMCEDMPIFYYILTCKSPKIYFYSTPAVLYRISKDSIARNRKHVHKAKLVNDNLTLLSMLRSKTSNLFKIAYLSYWSNYFRGSYARFIFKLNPLLIYYRLSNSYELIRNRSSINNFRLSCLSLIQKNQLHIKTCKNAFISDQAR